MPRARLSRYTFVRRTVYIWSIPITYRSYRCWNKLKIYKVSHFNWSTQSSAKLFAMFQSRIYSALGKTFLDKCKFYLLRDASLVPKVIFVSSDETTFSFDLFPRWIHQATIYLSTKIVHCHSKLAFVKRSWNYSYLRVIEKTTISKIYLISWLLA